MPNLRNNQKAVILFIVLATILVVVLLSGAVLGIISNQSKLTQHKINRIKAFYAAKGMMNYAQAKLRAGSWSAPASGSGIINYACHRDCVPGGGIPAGYSGSSLGNITADPYIPYSIQVNIYPKNSSLNNTVTRVDIKVLYPSD